MDKRTPEQISAKNKKHYYANLEKMRAKNAARGSKYADYNAAYRAANSEAHAEWCRRWRAENPDKVKANNAKRHWVALREINHRRRARKKNQVCTCCTPEDILSKFRRMPSHYELDHIIPIAIGGLHCLKNLQALTPEAHKLKTKADMKAIAAHRRNSVSLAHAA